MTAIAILSEPLGDGTSYRAVAGALQSTGRTPGEALDSLSRQLADHELGTLIVVQQMRPDDFFPAEKRDRLGDLMRRWREAQRQLGVAEQSELESLIAAETEAAQQRAVALWRAMQQ